jgi:diguanylate cyclase (GGDEF)-like protein
MVVRCYALLSGLLVATHLLWPENLRWISFLLVTLGALPAVAVGLVRAPRAVRAPWWLLLTGVALYNVGNLIWIWLVDLAGRATGDGSVAPVFMSAGGALLLTSAMVIVARRGRRDTGGIIDAIITSVAVGSLLWDALLLPSSTPDRVPVVLFVNLFAMVGGIGALLRVTVVSDRRPAALWLLTTATICALAGQVASAMTTDPVSGVHPDWTNVLFLAAYAVLGCAALHPSAARLTDPAPAPSDDLTTGRLAFLGLMLAVPPIVGGGRVLFGLPADGLLIAAGSAGLIPLVMIRIAGVSTRRRQAEQALHRMATSDTLTGLPNRAVCRQRLTAELNDGPDGLTVLFCDLDGFKPVNDRLGHAAGDQLLITVADRLRAGLRDGDLVSRFGGDEFVVVCRGADAAAAACDGIRAMVTRPIPAGGETVRIGISVGLAEARPGDSTDALLQRADLAMYAAKREKSLGALSLARA